MTGSKLRRPRVRGAGALATIAAIAVIAAAGGWTIATSFAGGRQGQPKHGSAALPLGAPGACRAYAGLPAGWRQAAHAGQVYIEGGAVTLGSSAGYQDERPRVQRAFAAFWIDATEVTNAQFAAFVAATGYVTDAERQGGGVVFHPPVLSPDGARDASWWKFAKDANWRQPEGPHSGSSGAANAPVVQVTRADALAYAAWLGRTLPSEAQWEAAAKAGRQDDALDRMPLDPQGRPTANFWQGNFPFNNDAADGFVGRAPVGCFAAIAYGLYDTIGNVWEWTRDPYTGAHQSHGHGDAARARVAAAATAPPAVSVIKGGSYLCAASYCVRYRAAARHPHETDLPASHIGFRTIREAG